MEDLDAGQEFLRLLDAVRVLRGPNGCPWDREQTHESLTPYLIEETYEAVEAIEEGRPEKIEDEMGDILLQVLLHSQIAGENDEFDIAHVCRRLREKLIRRHPHVFSELEVSGIAQIWRNWEQIKRSEPGYTERASALDGVPKSLPALARAVKISKKAARTGFDWSDVVPILDKLREETAELESAIASGDKEGIEEEIGDLLFTVINISRHRDIDPEKALRAMLEKFSGRFRAIEQWASEHGLSLEEMTIEEMDRLWEQAKTAKNGDRG